MRYSQYRTVQRKRTPQMKMWRHMASGHLSSPRTAPHLAVSRASSQYTVVWYPSSQFVAGQRNGETHYKRYNISQYIRLGPVTTSSTERISGSVGRVGYGPNKMTFSEPVRKTLFPNRQYLQALRAKGAIWVVSPPA